MNLEGQAAMPGCKMFITYWDSMVVKLSYWSSYCGDRHIYCIINKILCCTGICASGLYIIVYFANCIINDKVRAVNHYLRKNCLPLALLTKQYSCDCLFFYDKVWHKNPVFERWYKESCGMLFLVSYGQSKHWTGLADAGAHANVGISIIICRQERIYCSVLC